MNLKRCATRQSLANRLRRAGWLGALWPGVFGLSALLAADIASPLPPAESQRLFQIDPGLVIENIAAEPLTQSPCALAWDDQGRLFVAENRGYPTGLPSGAAAGVIARLEDTDGDGRMDRRIEFASGLTHPNGLLPWRDGLIVTCAPDVLFLRDADGDGRAEVREVWLSGFDHTKTTQLRVSHPTLGPDGWIYLTSGWAGMNKVHSPRHPERPAVEFASDCRFNPRTLEVQRLDGRAQFGMSFDDLGNRFICFNRVHIQHVVLPSAALKRNPNLPFSDTVQDVPAERVSDLIAPSPQSLAARIYPISANITTADSHAGQFSAACAVTIYRGRSLPAAYYGNAFACDPTGNLVHRDILTPVGGTFSSRIATEGREFVASPENWFRPVFLAMGPDDSLYICDMYRKTIEHPEYLPEEVRKRTDFEAGRDRGRIWRVRPAVAPERNGAQSAVAPERRPASANTTAGALTLAQDLIGPRFWVREQARRHLLEEPSPEAFAAVKRQFHRWAGSRSGIGYESRSSTDPAGPGPQLDRVLLLQTAAALAGILGGNVWAEVGADLVNATRDASPAVRSVALRLLDEQAAPQWDPSLPMFWAQDPSAAARFHAALLLGRHPSAAALDPLAAIAARDGGDRWTRAVLLSSLGEGRAAALLQCLLAHPPVPVAVEFWSELGTLLGIETSPANWADVDLESSNRANGLDCELALIGSALEATKRTGRFQTDSIPNLTTRFAQARQRAQDTSLTVAERLPATRLLAHAPPGEAAPVLLAILADSRAAELHRTAVRALLAQPQAASIRRLLLPEFWNTLLPVTRATAIQVLLSRADAAAVLLEQIEAGVLPASALSTAQRIQLKNHREPAVNAAAARLFATPGGSRIEAYNQAKTALALTPNPANGRAVFKAQCASCHRLDQEGTAVGPDIFGLRNQPKESILLHVLVPNHEINPTFAAYDVALRDGRTLTGLIASETPTQITLRQAQGIEERIARAEVISLRANQLSLMPDELEKAISPQHLADLLAYLKGEGPR